MTKFKVGDKVLVSKPEKNQPGAWIPDMDKLDGKILTVSSVDEVAYLCMNECGWTFHSDWCEKVEEYTVPTSKMIDWDKLRNAFFKECTEDKGGVKVVNMAPRDLFEWFVKKIGKDPHPT